MIRINKHFVKPGDTLKVRWCCRKSDQITLQLYNGYSISQISVGKSGCRKFKLKRFNGSGSVSIVYYDKEGNEKREMAQFVPYMTFKERWQKLKELRKNIPQDKKQLLVIFLICMLAVMLLPLIGSKFILFGFLIIAFYILYVLNK